MGTILHWHKSGDAHIAAGQPLWVWLSVTYSSKILQVNIIFYKNKAVSLISQMVLWFGNLGQQLKIKSKEETVQRTDMGYNMLTGWVSNEGTEK